MYLEIGRCFSLNHTEVPQCPFWVWRFGSPIKHRNLDPQSTPFFCLCPFVLGGGQRQKKKGDRSFGGHQLLLSSLTWSDPPRPPGRPTWTRRIRSEKSKREAPGGGALRWLGLGGDPRIGRAAGASHFLSWWTLNFLGLDHLSGK